MLAPDGKTPIGVKLKFQGFTGADHWPVSDGAPVNNALMNSYLVGGGGASVTLSGLVPDAPYDLYLFSNNSHAGAGAKFTVNGGTPQSTQGTQGAVFTKGVDYVAFKGVAADNEGRLKITLDAVDPAKFAEAIFNGLQLAGELPPPPAASQPPDNSSWAVKLWLKAEDVARAGLKPGDSVNKWTDAAWNIHFAPNSKAPFSDHAPTYAELTIPGNTHPVPVVQFDGQAGLRQLDRLDAQDEDLTAYVVYWPAGDGIKTWKQLLAKRDGTMCTYTGGIATALNPELVYTIDNESGIRLGANDQLPLALAGHPGEYNPGERFQGGIAEVIVFARHFGEDNEQQEMVENYFHEKYFGTDAQAKAGLVVPWMAAEPVRTVPPVQTEVAKASQSPDMDNGVGSKQANIFCLTDQANATNLEYAAGDVTLPFSYTAKVSTVPRPACLDFAIEPNPDCCHGFARIDGELWMFRMDWIIHNGRLARYKGPDIDHMTRVEDGKYPSEGGFGWFLGGMWYDESERKLYAPVHIEPEGSYRMHPVVRWPSRKIGLATSTDKGKTWEYKGDIITPETYYYNHEAYKFSGSYDGNGVSDFGFYVDTRSGYFYIFPQEAWLKKGQSDLVWSDRAARCAIKDKMAPGKWKYFYKGNWDESALGGKSSMIAPMQLWGVLYSTYLNKYICMYPSCSGVDFSLTNIVDGVMIGVCTDLSKQDWVCGYCPEAMFGFLKLFNAPGTDVITFDQTFRFYSYFADNSFQRLDITLEKSPMTVRNCNWIPRCAFEPHPESSDPILSRKTKIVGSASPEIAGTGNWADKTDKTSYEGRFKQSITAGSSIEFAFVGADVYWRAIRSPESGKADVYIDGTFRRTVDCFTPRSTSCEWFVYLKTGLDPDKTHNIKIVVKGEKNPQSQGTAIGHIAFEYSTESCKASAGFCSLMGKNNWNYQQRKQSQDSDLRFVPRDDVFVKDWIGDGNCRVGNNYQIPGSNAEAIRKWVAPHAGVVRVEGKAESTCAGFYVRLLHNTNIIWEPELSSSGQPAGHDLTVKVAQGDTISFLAGAKFDNGTNSTKVIWDPVVTYMQSQPAVRQPNPSSGQNLALGKYARSKMLVYTYQPFNAVDGDAGTAFTIYNDDKVSSGDDWLEVDLDKKYMIDRYVVVSKPPDASWRPTMFTLQRSDDGFTWTDVDTVSKNKSEKIERRVPPFAARYVRLYLPKGKPFSINEFELYHSEDP
jgi:hypothetical protein